MYSLFYMGYMLFGGITTLLGFVQLVDVFRRREEMHADHVENAKLEGYWTGYGEAWPIAVRQGEEGALQVCQMLAMQSAELVGMQPQMYNEFGNLVQSWPSYVLGPTELPHEVGLQDGPLEFSEGYHPIES